MRCAAQLSSAPPAVFEVLVDLSTYPDWLSIVGSALPVPGGDAVPAWSVELVGRIGPLTKRKRVRMERTLADEASGRVRFERKEHDGRDHHPWVLSAHARPSRGGTDLTVHLAYGGPSWLPGADRLLAQEARRAGPRLDAVVADRHGR